MDEKSFQKHIAKMRKQIEQTCASGLPKIVGARLVEMMKQNFQEEGFFGEKWRDVLRRTDPKRRNPHHPSDARRKILTGRTADLGRSIDFKTEQNAVAVFSDKVYAAVHNEGGRAGRGLRTVIPQRRFLGHHDKTDREIKALIKRELDKITQSTN